MNINDLHNNILNGNTSAEKELFQLLAVRFRLFVHQRIRNEQDCEDIVQEALMAISREYRDIKFNTSFSAWSYNVLKNRLLAYLKKSKTETRRLSEYNDQGESYSNETSDPLLVAQLVDCLKKVGGINRRYATMLDLHYQGYPVEEICERLEINRNHAYVILSRARSMLKLCLEKGELPK